MPTDSEFNPMRSMPAALRDGSWANPERIRVYSTILLILEVLVMAFCVAGTHGLIVPLARPASTDFVSFHAAGSLAVNGTAPLVYDRQAHYAAEQAMTENGIPYNFFYYPPVFLLICAVLGRLPYMVAFFTFQAVTCSSCVLAVRRILPNISVRCLAAFPAVFWTWGTGQNAFLSASLFAGGTIAVDRYPVLAGMAFGALCYKPHLGLLIPVALAAGGQWRAFASAGLTAAALILSSGLLFGWDTWAAFFAAAANAGSVYGAQAIDMAGLSSPHGAILVWGGSLTMACAVQAAAALAVAACVATAWRHGRSLPVRAALLTAGTPVAVPVLLFYDLMLDGIAIAWLIAAGRAHGFPPWQKTLLTLLFVMPMLSGNLNSHSKLLIAPSAAALGFALALAQAHHEWRRIKR